MGTLLKSTKTLKLLGFKYSTQPGVKEHFEQMVNIFRVKLWYLRHLKHSGMTSDDLIILFKTILQSILHYLCPSYHSLLNKGLSNRIEELQKFALEIIYGLKRSHEERVKKAGDIKKLEHRRIEITKKFAIKTAANN